MNQDVPTVAAELQSTITHDSRPKRMVLGTMNFGRRCDEKTSLDILHRCYSAGICYINTADFDYSGRSEKYVGQFIKEMGGRHRVFLLVEISGRDMGVPHDPNLTAEYLPAACRRSLERLDVEYVDRFIVPRPSFKIPLDETLGALHEQVVHVGMGKSIGVSTFPSWLTCHGQHICESRGFPLIASEMAPYNLLDRRSENEIIPGCQHWGMEFYGWGGLAQGLLAGRYGSAGYPPVGSRAAELGGIYAERVTSRAMQVSEEFVRAAREFGYRPAAASLAWCLSHPTVTGVVVGPRTSAHVDDMVAAMTLTLDPGFVRLLDGLVPPGSAVTNFFNSAPWMLQRLHW